MGGLRRQKAKERGLTLEEYNKLGETDPSTDLEVDMYQKELGEKEDNFIIEGRTSWHFIPHSFKIFLDVSFEEGAKRIYSAMLGKNDRNEGTGLNSEKAVLESIKRRRESDIKRYQKYFGFNVFDKDHYDLIIDTTDKTIDQVFKEIVSVVDQKLSGNIDKK
jgi:cytidylate kinase